jgi:serralysin
VQGSVTLFGGSGSQLDLTLGTTDYVGGSGVDTVAAFSGSLTATGGAGGGLFVGSPAGRNIISGGAGPVTIFGAGNGDVLSAGGAAGDKIQAGPGAETISGLASTGEDVFFAGPGSDVILLGGGTAGVSAGPGGAMTVVGGSGLSLLGFTNGYGGSALIKNFDPSHDFLTLTGFGANEAANDVGQASRTRDDLYVGKTATMSAPSQPIPVRWCQQALVFRR